MIAAAVTAAVLSVTVIGHGGYHEHGVAPDSIGSQTQAWSHGMRCAESDARQTSDGHMIQLHDAELSHTTNGSGIVEEQTFAYVRSLELSDGQQVPTIRESMRNAKQHGHGCLLMELKGAYWTEADFKVLQRQAKNFGLLRTFHPYLARPVLLQRAHDAAPRLRSVWKLLGPTDTRAIHEYGVWAVTPRWGGIYRNNVTRIHQAGAKVYAGVSDGATRWRKVKRSGADGLLTNNPEAVRWFGRHQ